MEQSYNTSWYEFLPIKYTLVCLKCGKLTFCNKNNIFQWQIPLCVCLRWINKRKHVRTVSLGCVFMGNVTRDAETFISLTGKDDVLVSLACSSTAYEWVCFSHVHEDESTKSNHCSTLSSLKMYKCVKNDVSKGKSNCFCVSYTKVH